MPAKTLNHGIPVRRPPPPCAAHRRPAPRPFFADARPTPLSQRALGWLTILGGCILFTSNMDRLIRRLTNNTKSYALSMELDKTAQAKAAH